jgi:hypothetical protein
MGGKYIGTVQLFCTHRWVLSASETLWSVVTRLTSQGVGNFACGRDWVWRFSALIPASIRGPVCHLLWNTTFILFAAAVKLGLSVDTHHALSCSLRFIDSNGRLSAVVTGCRKDGLWVDSQHAQGVCCSFMPAV